MKFMHKAADILAATREYVEGCWIQGSLKDDDGGVCLFGGMLFSQGVYGDQDDVEPYVNESEELREACWLLADVVDPEMRTKCSDHERYAPVNELIAWNDNEETTEQQVTDALAKAEKIGRMGYDPDAA